MPVLGPQATGVAKHDMGYILYGSAGQNQQGKGEWGGEKGFPPSSKQTLPSIPCMQLSLLTQYSIMSQLLLHAGHNAVGNRWCPEEEAGWVSWLFFGFVGGLVERGYRKPLRQEDLWALPRTEETDLQCRLFDAALKATIDPILAPQVELMSYGLQISSGRSLEFGLLSNQCISLSIMMLRAGYSQQATFSDAFVVMPEQS